MRQWSSQSSLRLTMPLANSPCFLRGRFFFAGRARRDELGILGLVGASRSFVSTPFLLEGLLEGAAGGAVALVLLFGLFRLVLPGFEFGLELLLGGVVYDQADRDRQRAEHDQHDGDGRDD